MSELLERLIEEARALSLAEKTLLAERLLSETAESDPQWEAAWSAECDRRLKALEDGAATTVPSVDVRQRLTGR